MVNKHRALSSKSGANIVVVAYLLFATERFSRLDLQYLAVTGQRGFQSGNLTILLIIDCAFDFTLLSIFARG